MRGGGNLRRVQPHRMDLSDGYARQDGDAPMAAEVAGRAVMGPVAAAICLVRRAIVGGRRCHRAMVMLVRTGGVSPGMIVLRGVSVGADHLGNHKRKRDDGR
jgi:hypothetical protein